MSQQVSWSCLSVQEFLHFCNWEGQKAEEIGRWGGGEQSALDLCPSAPLPRRQTSWQCVTVQEFFSRSNWEGEMVSNLPLTSAPLPPRQTSWQRLTVREFFNCCNWQGQPPENNELQLDPYSRLKQQVKEFFQFIPWEGNPEIGTLPKPATNLHLPSADLQLRFTNLSDLF